MLFIGKKYKKLIYQYILSPPRMLGCIKRSNIIISPSCSHDQVLFLELTNYFIMFFVIY